jgi:hypothetical protein
MSKTAAQGYASWANQKSKCYNAKNPDFKYYGAKNIRVLYSSREFVGWWLYNLKTKKWDSPTVGRLDHEKDYCFENIQMEERIDNSSERVRRKGRPIGVKPKKVLVLLKKRPFLSFKSANQAAIALKLNVSTVCRIADGKYQSGRKKIVFKTETKEGYSFKYYEVT